MLDAGVLLIRVLHGVLMGFVSGDFGGDLFGDDLANLVSVLPVNVAKLFIEGAQDVAQAIQFRLGGETACARRDRLDLGILILQSDGSEQVIEPRWIAARCQCRAGDKDSDDAPYREFGGYGEQLWTSVTFRAVENHTAMVVTGAATVAAIIDPYGRQVALEFNQEDSQVTLVEDVPLGSGNTIYLYLGDWLGWISLATYVFLTGLQITLQRRAKKAGTIEVGLR